MCIEFSKMACIIKLEKISWMPSSSTPAHDSAPCRQDIVRRSDVPPPQLLRANGGIQRSMKRWIWFWNFTMAGRSRSTKKISLHMLATASPFWCFHLENSVEPGRHCLVAQDWERHSIKTWRYQMCPCILQRLSTLTSNDCISRMYMSSCFTCMSSGLVWMNEGDAVQGIKQNQNSWTVVQTRL